MTIKVKKLEKVSLKYHILILQQIINEIVEIVIELTMNSRRTEVKHKCN